MTTASANDLKEKLKSQTSSRALASLSTKLNQTNPSIMVTQKPNHVSTVLLHGIPIVSLYIEGQERLCLAQISNTLLKAYSYNEIHNRRVALGITCVQCTPVQLEILRRAGAMPVSSRRCGMITRREAERLCKSFLGDNAPPRLPEDFAFNVQHKCAWGCRGAFLPSRYNSSRAKCIKCTFCGMFFSPNKFIFHSHRVSASDKYVQPDAANFNSWRRHMFLAGQPPEEIIHAWEDVKAMFNGGTRKRLLHSGANTACIGAERRAASADLKVNEIEEESLVLTKRTRKSSGCANIMDEETSIRGGSSNVKISHSETMTNMRSAAIIVPQRFPHFQAEPSSLGTQSLQISGLAPQLMVDYMFQTHQQNQKISNGKNGGAPFNFPNCNSIPWLKTPTCSSPFKCTGANELRLNSTSTASLLSPSNFSVPNLLNTSAFKPVLQNNFQRGKPPTMSTMAAATATFVSSSMYTSSSTNTSSPNNHHIASNTQNNSLALTSFSPSSRILFPTSIVVRSQSFPALPLPKHKSFSDDDTNTEHRTLQMQRIEDEDEIEVDIETTEDDANSDCKESQGPGLPENIQLHLTQNCNLNELDSSDNQQDCSNVLGTLYRNQNSTETSSSENNTNLQHVRSVSRSRKCSCSSSNDSLYMSAQTKSEKEGSSRATSTTSVDESSNARSSLQDPVNVCSLPWKEISKQGEWQHSLLNNPGPKRQEDPTNIDGDSLPMKSPKSTLNENSDIDQNPVSADSSSSLPNTAVALFDVLNSKNKNNNILNKSNQNKSCNGYNSDLWQVASLCLHRPHLTHNLSNPSNFNRQYSSMLHNQQLKE